MEVIEKKFINFFKSIGKFFAENWITGLIALFCAVVLWGFVLTNQNPERVKTLTGVSLSFEGESDLIARKLVVYGNMDEVLPELTVKVSTELLNYSNLKAGDITATVSLRNISAIGEHTLEVHAVSSTGTVVSVSPSTVTVTVDRLSTKSIPVEVTTAGEQDDSYWYSEPVIANDEIEIEGALTALSSINRAVGVVDISDRHDAFSDAVTLSLLDSNGETVDPAKLYGDVPSVKVQMEIQPKKTVPLDLEGALTGVDQLPSIYEIYSMFTLPGEVTIIGEQSVLSGIDSLQLSALDVLALYDRDRTEALESEGVQLNIIIPDGVRIMGDITTVDAYVSIREKRVSKTFTGIPLSVTNRSDGYSYETSVQTMDITIIGRISFMNKLDARDIRLYIDATNLAAGSHTVTVEVDANLLLEITSYELEPNEITLTVTEK